MNRTRTLLLVSAVAIPLALSSAGTASAIEPLLGTAAKSQKIQGARRVEEIKSGMSIGKRLKEVIERGDYPAFQAITQFLPEDAELRGFTREQFEQLREMHRLFVRGRTEHAKDIAKALTLTNE